MAIALFPAANASPKPSAGPRLLAVPRPRPRRRGHPIVWILVPLAYGTIAWALAGRYLVDETAQQIVEVAGILLIGVLGLLLAFRVRTSNVQVERAYSEHLEELSQRLRTFAYRDSLTDLYNYRYFHEQLTHEVERATRYARPVSLILMDVNNFKEVNDTFGHLLGDKVLGFIGQVIREQVRGADIAARYGGDEFVLILPDTPREAAEITARKLAEGIAGGRPFGGSLSESLSVTISYGVASCPDEGQTVSDLLQLADERLYANKADARLSA